ncbi:MAG: TIGR03663 family protein [Candidatus Aminicenantes bacterium]|nr:TIGR03663 family protein [Candidatus Aminicenantes bacterium]
MKKGVFVVLFLLILTGAMIFRTADLDNRPMHHDEANQALKFKDLLEEGRYVYDRTDHHGPTLYYLSLPLVLVRSGKSFTALTETTLRLLPALLGAGLFLLLLIPVRDTGRLPVLLAGFLLAISPVMVFFSRFYIQETLLLFFGAGLLTAVWRYVRAPSMGWALLAGLFVGLAYATKETSIILFFALAVASLATYFSPFRIRSRLFLKNPNWKKHLPLAAGAALLTVVVLYTSFFTHWRGPLDSLLSFPSYLSRAEGAGMHVQPWYYYIRMLIRIRFEGGPVWSEGLILGLALIGIISLFVKNRSVSPTRLGFFRVVLVYTLISTVIFSLIPYKTPWNCLPFFFGFILLSGQGGAFLIERPKKRWMKGIPLILILVLGYNLGRQSYRANFVYHADTRNPYVYAQTSTDFLNLVQRIRDLAALHAQNKQMLIKVVTGPYETWPLPWYLRDFERIGYWETLAKAGRLDEADVVITDIKNTDILPASFLESVQSEYYGLRPEVLLAVHIRKDLWETYIRTRINVAKASLEGHD